MDEGNDQGAENGAENGTGPTGEGRAADDGGGNYRELGADADGRTAVAIEGQGHDGGDADDESHQRHDHDASARDTDTGEEGRLAVAADGLDAAAKGGVVEKNPAEDADDEHYPDADPDAEDGIAAADPLEEPCLQVVARDRSGIGHHQPETPVEAESAEGDDDGWDAKGDTEGAVQEATDGSDENADGDGYPDRVVVAQGDGHHDTAQHPDRADREVDIAHGNHEHHTDGHDADVRSLTGDVDEVLGGEKLVRHQHRQQDDEHDEGAKHPDLVDLTDSPAERTKGVRRLVPRRYTERRLTHRAILSHGVTQERLS